MKIAFYYKKPEEKTWFNIAAADEGFDVSYIEKDFNAETISLADCFDAVCISETDQIDDELISCIKKQGIDAVLLRSDAINYKDNVKKKRHHCNQSSGKSYGKADQSKMGFVFALEHFDYS